MPNIIVHEVLNATTINGELPDVTATTQVSTKPTYGGITEFFAGCSKAGRVDAGIQGNSLVGIGANLSGIASFKVIIRDRDTVYSTGAVPAFEVLDSTENEFTDRVKDVNSFYYQFRDPVMIPPNHSVEFVTAQASGVGRLFFVLGSGFQRGAGFVSVISN